MYGLMRENDFAPEPSFPVSFNASSTSFRSSVLCFLAVLRQVDLTVDDLIHGLLDENYSDSWFIWL